jgi:hypothetical protein
MKLRDHDMPYGTHELPPEINYTLSIAIIDQIINAAKSEHPLAGKTRPDRCCYFAQ